MRIIKCAFLVCAYFISASSYAAGQFVYLSNISNVSRDQCQGNDQDCYEVSWSSLSNEPSHEIAPSGYFLIGSKEYDDSQGGVCLVDME